MSFSFALTLTLRFKMIRICYGEHHQGDRKIGEKPPFENKEETHGLCDACFEHEKIEIRLALKRLRDAGWRPNEPFDIHEQTE